MYIYEYMIEINFKNAPIKRLAILQKALINLHQVL